MDSTQMWLPFLQQRLADEENEKSQYWNGHPISMGDGGEQVFIIFLGYKQDVRWNRIIVSAHRTV